MLRKIRIMDWKGLGRFADRIISAPPIQSELLKSGAITFRRNTLYEALIEDGGYIFTQQKTGTNYLCNVVAFYNSQAIGKPCFDFDRIHEHGVIRTVQRDPGKLAQAIAFAQNGLRPYFQSHEYHRASADHLVLTTRSVPDFAVSSYHFHYINHSRSRRKKTVDQALPFILKSFILRHKNQLDMASRASRVSYLDYSDMITAPIKTFSALIDEMHGEVISRYLDQAVEMASANRLKSQETARKGGGMTKSSADPSAPSLIRSGKIGEGFEFFSKQQLDTILSSCEAAGINPYRPFDGLTHSPGTNNAKRR